MSKALIINVGTGPEVDHGIIFSIRTHNPDFIIFILTKESLEKTFPKILESSEMKNKEEGKDWEKCILEDENDLENIRIECEKLIEKLIKQKKYNSSDIAIDYTSGTKSMSCALTIAGVYKNVGFLSYVYGKRNKDGRVISGTERKIEFSPIEIYCRNMLKDAANYFNLLFFEPCTSICEEVLKLLKEEKINRITETLKKLSIAYNFWDNFDHKSCFSILKEMKDEDLLIFNIKSKVSENKTFLYKIVATSDNPFLYEKVVDLFENALRKGDIQKKYDDAVARFYRLLEYIAQIFLKEKDLLKKDDKENWVLDLQKLPENLKPNYIEEKAGLMKCLNLLSDLGNENITSLYKDQNLKKIISIRNKSILAHGFDPVSKNSYEKIKFFIEDFLKKIIPSFENLKNGAKFPKINILF